MGQIDQAISLLNKAVSAHSVDVVFLNVEPKFDELRADPRFTTILKNIGLK